MSSCLFKNESVILLFTTIVLKSYYFYEAKNIIKLLKSKECFLNDYILKNLFCQLGIHYK